MCKCNAAGSATATTAIVRTFLFSQIIIIILRHFLTFPECRRLSFMYIDCRECAPVVFRRHRWRCRCRIFLRICCCCEGAKYINETNKHISRLQIMILSIRKFRDHHVCRIKTIYARHSCKTFARADPFNDTTLRVFRLVQTENHGKQQRPSEHCEHWHTAKMNDVRCTRASTTWLH